MGLDWDQGGDSPFCSGAQSREEEERVFDVCLLKKKHKRNPNQPQTTTTKKKQHAKHPQQKQHPDTKNPLFNMYKVIKV